MSINRMSAAILLLATGIPVLAAESPLAPAPNCANAAEEALYSLAISDQTNPLPGFAMSRVQERRADRVTAFAARPPREVLAAFAMTLRDIRYRHGGRVPQTGFDCSGFVQYVFAHSLGIDLPDTSTSQFRAGTLVARDELQTGDLVFFHTRGKNVSHVGIYLDNGRFIHSPSTGKRVRVDELSDHYWAKRFVGAKRPNISIEPVSHA
jgi:cell wall-associated NlpC family hydrolase